MIKGFINKMHYIKLGSSFFLAMSIATVSQAEVIFNFTGVNSQHQNVSGMLVLKDDYNAKASLTKDDFIRFSFKSPANHFTTLSRDLKNIKIKFSEQQGNIHAQNIMLYSLTGST